jgi:hypothetical protein
MRPLSTFVFALLAVAALPAQNKEPGKDPAKDAAKGKAPKVETPKDDSKTAKDPVIVAIDKFRKAKVSTKSADWRTHLSEPSV